MITNEPSPYGSLAHDGYERHYQTHRCEQAPLLINEKRSSSVIFRPHSNRKQHLLMAAWAAVVIMASYFVLTHSPTPISVFQTNSFNQPLDGPEEWIKGLPSSDSIKGFFHSYASESHLAGSEKDRRLAEWTRDLFVQFGVTNTSIETYWPLLNYPKTRYLSLMDEQNLTMFEASLKEDNDENATPTFHGYSGDGDVTAPVVYVNYGDISDFQYLQELGVNVTGSIALVRSGGNSRGLKVKAAEQFGCVGVLIYNDPIDQPSNGQMYPDGPWRSSSSVERGTVHYLSMMAGDPSTPGYASLENSTRLLLNETDTVPHIPSLPISWDDATPFLNATHQLGVQIPQWQGGIPDIGYYSGPSQHLVHLVNINDYQVKPVWNVIGRIDGTEEPDRVILLGNHRDAWSYGGADPSSGSASLLELVRIFGVLMESGWRPRRTIMFASWDAEEFGSIGSTEWVENHKEWLDDVAVAYLNVDMAVTGTKFAAQSSPLLHRLLYEVTSSVIDPSTSLSVLEAWALSNAENHFTEWDMNGDITPDGHMEKKKEHHEEPELKLIGPLGAGSDYVAFFHHVGISSMTMGFHGDYGVYHSNNDGIKWMETFGDPTYEYHQTLVKIWGLLALRLSSDVILPMYPLDYAHQLDQHISSLESIYHRNNDTAPDDDDDNEDMPPCDPPTPELTKHKKKNKNKKQRDEFLPKLALALHDLKHTSKKFEHKKTKVLKKLGQVKVSSKTERRVEKLNARVSQFERVFIKLDGLQGRPWYRHMVYAPGEWSGYASQALPGLSAAFESNDEQEIQQAEEQLATVLEIARQLLKGHYENADLLDGDSDLV
ncbi:hypothetical protein BC941DRAFT_509113 [Chlamydoabsidia padenii]|nr:hypothetical protein BC941DRAFT_509113 [Chlamydoabsidia padenii]